MSEEIDYEYTDAIVCPYCGYEFSDCWEMADSNDELACYGCDKVFSYERIVDVTYKSSKDQPNDR